MKRRSAIPASLKRQLLVECGHRCAVTGCGHPAVEFHHIVPWAQCQEHDYRNMIALCPNHHVMADRGEIDRKAQRMYKSRTAAFHDGFPLDTSPDTLWVMEILLEVEPSHPAIEVELEFPRFLAPDLAELTLMLHARAWRRLLEYRRLRLNVDYVPEEWETGPMGLSSLSESLQVVRLDDEVISLSGTVISYGSGAAHPNYTTNTLNYLRRPLTPLQLGDLLALDEEGPRKLSNLLRMELDRHCDEKEEPMHFLSAFADAEFFHAFNLRPYGLQITLDPGSIGPMCDPVRRVTLSAVDLAERVGLRSLGVQLWSRHS